MPTKKKRVGFIPREEVMRIIDRLSVENNLSNSKIISILVEEALSARGIFNKEIVTANKLYDKTKDNLIDMSSDSAEIIENAKQTIDIKLENNFNTSKSNHLNEANQDAFDLETYKKFLLFLKFQEMMDKYNT